VAGVKEAAAMLSGMVMSPVVEVFVPLRTYWEVQDDEAAR
jgi:hypothetical protein